LSTGNILELLVQPESLYVQPGESVVIDMDVRNLLQKVNGCQAVLAYDSTYLNAGWVVPGGGAWDQLIWESWAIAGELDTAIGVNAAGATGTDNDETVAVITLTAGATEGVTRMEFRADESDVESTWLSDMNAQVVVPTKIHSQMLVIDGTNPVAANLTATQNAGDVLDCAAPTLQGTVNISVDVSDALAGLAGEPAVTVTQGASSLAVTYVDESPAGTFNYTVTIDASTANGTWDIDATATDLAGNSALVSGTLCVDKNQVTGTVSMLTQSSASYAFDRDVVFKATDAGGVVLATWTVTVSFVNDPDPDADPLTSDGTASGSYTLTQVPDAIAGLSAKTDWSLRKKELASLDGSGQAVVDITVPGGDLNGSNSVNILDYSLMKTNWMGNHDPLDPVADVNGDGVTGSLDYSLMKSNWFQVGDPE
jgi:hypothetical protein